MEIINYYKLESICAWIGNEKVFPCDENGLPNIKEGINLIELKSEWFQLLNKNEKDYISNLIKQNQQKNDD
jgi:hypothetical protein